jgi:hypothetical protein
VTTGESESDDDDENKDGQLAKMIQAQDALLDLGVEDENEAAQIARAIQISLAAFKPSPVIEPSLDDAVLPQDRMNVGNDLEEESPLDWQSTDDDESIEDTSGDQSRRILYDSGHDERARFSTALEDTALFGGFKKLPIHIRQKIWCLSYTRRLIEVLKKDGE